MKSLWVEDKINYDGSQLRRLFSYENFGLIGNSIVSFRGACNIPKANIKDGEDLFAGEKIYSEDMLHFIIECHDTPLEAMIGHQRLFSAILKDCIENKLEKRFLIRKGDDLFQEDKKLNISIATANSLSAMIHCGVNISSQNTPVPTLSLIDLGIEAKDFANEILSSWVKEYAGIQSAKAKVFTL